MSRFSLPVLKLKFWLQGVAWLNGRVDTCLHIRDHVVGDFFIPEVFCDEAITVAPGHATSPTWHVPESIKK